MNNFNWPRKFVILGIVIIALTVIYHFYYLPFYLDLSFSLAEFSINVLPGFLLFALGYWGAGFWTPKNQFPTEMECPRCKNFTDQNPCSHCNFDILNPETPEEQDQQKKGFLKNFILIHKIEGIRKIGAVIFFILALLVFAYTLYFFVQY